MVNAIITIIIGALISGVVPRWLPAGIISKVVSIIGLVITIVGIVLLVKCFI